jgi:hypothetical protein
LFTQKEGFDEALYYRPDIGNLGENDEPYGNQCNLFPVVTNRSGSAWEPALLYMAHRVFDLANCAIPTNHNVAEELVHFKRFLDEKNLAFDNFDAAASYELPTYRPQSFTKAV